MSKGAGQQMPTLVEGTRGATLFSDVVQGAIGVLAYFRDRPMTNAHAAVLTKDGDTGKILVEIRYQGTFAGYLRTHDNAG